MLNNIADILVNSPFTPHERIKVTRKEIVREKQGGDNTTIKVVGEFTVFVSPPDTLNKNEGAILQQLLEGNKDRDVYMVYGITPDIKDGDTVYRFQTDKKYYEVKIVGFHGNGNEFIPISHHKCYIVSKEKQTV